MMGMRLSEGLDMARYEQLAGRGLPQERLRGLADLGMVTISGDRLSATDQGRAVLNAVLRELLLD